jgi:hypothetical protein
MPETSPKQKSNPEPLTSGDSNFESAKGSPALKLTGQGENSSPQMTGLGESSHPLIKELVEGGPQIKFEETHDLLVEPSY